MIIGTPLVGKFEQGEPDTIAVYYSPWFPRGGNRARFTCNIIDYDAMDYMKITVQTKTSDESDSGASTVSGWEEDIDLDGGSPPAANSDVSWLAGAALNSTSSAGFEDLVRLKYELRSNAKDGWVHFRMLATQWFPH